MTVPEVLDTFHTYIREDIPFRLIDLHTMQLVDVKVVEQTYLPIVNSITEADIERHTSYANQRREDVITSIVRGIVKYAILSHTWSRSGRLEFLYHEMIMGSPRESPGWHKLESFCGIARHFFKCRFGWADTVCLDYMNREDQQSASENLFHWYRNAYVCIVHLEGSVTVEDLDTDIWFLRGWTLTELLAPIRIKFYGSGWKALNNDFLDNDKADRSFVMALSNASGIPVDDLRSFRPGPDRIRQKLSWAAKRRTHRLEDRAYSLMSIFDIRLSVEYGEGEKAFIRLMLEAIPRSGECDVFAWGGERSIYHLGLPPSPAGYGPLHDDQQLNPTAHHYRLCGDRALSIRSNHLKIRVILAPISLPEGCVTRYKPIPLAHAASVNEVMLVGPQPWNTQPAADAQMVVGVIDYGWTDSPDEGILREGDKYYGFLLYRTSGDAEWQKVITEKVIYLTSEQQVIQKLETLSLYS